MSADSGHDPVTTPPSPGSGAPPVRVVDILGQSLRVSVRPGTEAGPPLLLCCGIGAGFEVLQDFVDALDERITVVRFDVPGVGGSPVGPVPYGFPGYAYLAKLMMRVLGYRRFDVLGLSWGGALAQQLAVQHPRTVGRVILVATGTGSVMVPAHPQVLWKMLTPKRFADPDYAASIAPDLYGGTARTAPYRIHDLLGDTMRIGSGRGYRHQLMAGIGWTSLPFLPLLCQPVLVLSGDDDPIIPLINGKILATLIPHGHLHVYHGGHLALVTEARQLAPVIADFIRPRYARERDDDEHIDPAPPATGGRE